MPLVIGLTASLGAGKEGLALSHLIKLCANLDCRHVSCLRSKEDLDDLKFNIPSPLKDELCAIDLGKNFDDLMFEIKNFSLEIINKVKLESSSIRLGGTEYEQFLFFQNQSAEIAKNLNVIIAIKYLTELNLLFTRVEDFPIDYCLNKLNVFAEARNLAELTQIETFCRKILFSTINYIESKKQSLFLNLKLSKLIENITKFHKDYSRGFNSRFNFFFKNFT